jgi:DNA-binding transcriptional regulator YhcF (GntR family)
VVTIDTGRNDPRGWVQAAYTILDAMEPGQIGPQGKLLTRAELARTLGIHPTTVARAYRELTSMSLISLVPGRGYFADTRTNGTRAHEAPSSEAPKRA